MSLPINQIICGHVLDVLRGFPDESVHCVITSPPYWGLRSYRTPDQIWDGDGDCEHSWSMKSHNDTRGIEGSNLSGRNPYQESEARLNYREGFCQKCGAWRGSLGLEPTPDCERPFLEIRSDLSSKERILVISELERLGLLDVQD